MMTPAEARATGADRPPRLRVTGAVVAMLTFVILGLTTVAPVLTGGPAHACSCASPIPVADLVGEREVAFVGVAGPGREIEPGMLVHDVTVEVAVKGDLPPVIQIAAGTFDAACGTRVPVGLPKGFVPSAIGPTGRAGEWSVDMCNGLVDSAALRAVVGMQLPMPTGTGPVSALVIARAGPAEAVAVAADGRPAGWVDLPPADGFVDLVGVAVCPGGKTAALVSRRFDRSGEESATMVHLLDLATLTVADTPAITVEPVAFGLWSVRASVCLDDSGTTMVLEGDSTSHQLHTLSSSGRSFERLDGPMTMDGSGLIQVVDGTVVRRDLRAPDSTGTPLFTLAAGVEPIDLGVFGDAVLVARASADRTVIVDRYALDGAVTGSWLVDGVDTARISVATGGALLVDGSTGRRRWLRDNGEVVNIAGNSGAALLVDGVLSWSYEGSASYVLSDGSQDPSWSFLSGPSIRSVVPLTTDVAVDRSSAAARPLPVIERPGTILPVEVKTTANPAPASTAAGVDTTTSDRVTEAASAESANDGSATGVVVAAFAVALVLVAVGLGRSRRRRATESAETDPPTRTSQ